MKQHLFLASLLMSAGCMSGPDYNGPPQTAPQAGARPAFQRTGDIPTAVEAAVARWWEALGDPSLNDLIARALANNPNVAVAQARLRQARANFRLERANLLPNVSGTTMYAHAHLPGVNFNQSGSNSNQSNTTDLNLYNLGFDARWEIDLFGGQRRTAEAAEAQAGAAEANLADVKVSLSAEIAQAYVNLRDRQQRLQLNGQSVALEEQVLALTRQRFASGTASAADVADVESELESTRADLVPLNAELDAYLNELATLTGQAPGALDAALRPLAPLPLPPAQIPVGDPASLLQRRPDIRAAERNLAAATAKIGAAEAARFPRLSFMGIIGIGGTKLSDLGHLDDFAALVAPQLSWSFLDFGRNRARVTQAEAARDEAEAQYQAAVLVALRDAEDSLSRFRNRRAAVATLARSEAAASQSVQLNAQRYQAGTITLVNYLDVQRRHLAAQQQLSTAKANLTNDFVAIQKAMGFGWEQPANP